MMGEHDSATSAVALRADKTHFFHKGRYHDTNVNDDELLVPFKELLTDTKAIKKRLFVLHLIGSHPDACQRLHDYPISFHLGYGKHVDCYLTSIKKTDNFIKNMTDILSDQPYALVYFSDHGVSINKETIKVNAKVKNNYEVPFVILDSEFKEHTKIEHRVSQRHFLDFMATWFGVQTNLTNPRYRFDALHELPKADKIEVFNWQEMINVDTLEHEKVLK